MLCAKEKRRNFCLEKFDYEGYSIARYRFDVVPYIFDIDEDDNYIYGFNYQNEDYFYRYFMNWLLLFYQKNGNNHLHSRDYSRFFYIF